MKRVFILFAILATTCFSAYAQMLSVLEHGGDSDVKVKCATNLKGVVYSDEYSIYAVEGDGVHYLKFVYHEFYFYPVSGLTNYLDEVIIKYPLDVFINDISTDGYQVYFCGSKRISETTEKGIVGHFNFYNIFGASVNIRYTVIEECGKLDKLVAYTSYGQPTYGQACIVAVGSKSSTEAIGPQCDNYIVWGTNLLGSPMYKVACLGRYEQPFELIKHGHVIMIGYDWFNEKMVTRYFFPNNVFAVQTADSVHLYEAHNHEFHYGTSSVGLWYSNKIAVSSLCNINSAYALRVRTIDYVNSHVVDSKEVSLGAAIPDAHSLKAALHGCCDTFLNIAIDLNMPLDMPQGTATAFVRMTPESHFRSYDSAYCDYFPMIRFDKMAVVNSENTVHNDNNIIAVSNEYVSIHDYYTPSDCIKREAVRVIPIESIEHESVYQPLEEVEVNPDDYLFEGIPAWRHLTNDCYHFNNRK